MENIILIMLLTTCLGILLIVYKGVNNIVKIYAKQAEYDRLIKRLEVDIKMCRDLCEPTIKAYKKFNEADIALHA